MKRLNVVFLFFVIPTICIYSITIPFNPYLLTIPNEILEDQPTIENGAFVYSTSIQFYSYSINAKIYKYIDSSKGNDFIFFYKERSTTEDVFSQFIKEVIQEYLKEATYMYYNIEDDGKVIRRKYFFYKNNSKTIFVYINISYESGLVGLGISSTSSEVFSDTEFFNNLDDYFYEVGERIFDKSRYKYDEVEINDNFIDIFKYIFVDKIHIEEKCFGKEYHGLPVRGFSKSFFIKKPKEKSTMILSGFENSKNLVITIGQRYMRTPDTVSQFIIDPEAFPDDFIFINIKGLMNYNPSNLISIVPTK